jgi:uncharacterized protein
MTDQAPTLCIHHHPCADGFTAAWAVYRRFGSDQVKFHPGKHGAPPPDVTGEHVVIVDFSYPRDVLLEMCKTAASILVLDHHASAQKDLEDFPRALWTWEDHIEDALYPGHSALLDRIGVLFDMNRSGAMIAWEFFHPGAPVPKLVQHVQDRDLWQFKIPGTREIQSWVFSFPYDFFIWTDLANELDIMSGWSSAVTQGLALDRKHQKDVAELIIATKRQMVIGGYEVPVVNLPYTMASDAAGTLANGEVFAAAYFDADDGARVFSLRSRGDFDVGTLAKQMGEKFGTNGGGHKNASGFRAPRGWEGERG